MITQLTAELDEYWLSLVKELRDSMVKEKIYASGNTAQKIGEYNTKPVVITANQIKITLVMPSYYIFLDEGVSGAEKNTNISRFRYKDKAPPISAIKKFMLNRAINPKPRNTKSGRRQSAEEAINSLAFAIAHSIWSKGTRKTDFYKNVVNDKKILDFQKRLLEKYSKYYIDSIVF
jgi:hypothetical protein|tara:strand:+ start:216 stop:743 length:528 start_codon:yes stop_codon:yes gene_type:complete